MKTLRLRDVTSDELVRMFIDVGIAQGDALLRDEVAKYNRLFDKNTAIVAELKARPGDHRRMLLSLFDHNNVQVRMNAAKVTLALAPEAARQLLETIATNSKGPQGGHAGMCIYALDRGIFKPT